MSKIAMYEGYGSPFGSRRRRKNRQKDLLAERAHNRGGAVGRPERHTRRSSPAVKRQQAVMKACARKWRVLHNVGEERRETWERGHGAYRRFMKSCLKKK